MSHGNYILEYHNNWLKAVNSETVKVDGEVVATGGALTEWKKRFEFTIVDGNQSYTAKLEMEPNIWLATIVKFRLIVSGKILYSEGNW